jgi:hypothetical protein
MENLLGRTVIVRELDVGIRIARETGNAFRIATLEGDIINPGGSMTGGSLQKREYSLLGRESEMESLRDALEANAEEQKKLTSAISELGREREDRQAELERLEQELQSCEIALAREREKVDIIRWDSNIRNFITNALAPAKLKAFEIDETSKRVRITVSEDQLSLAIGKRGQNARLTSKLTGWMVDIEPEVVVTKGFEEKVAEAVEMLAAIPGITREQADILVHHGLLSLEALLQADTSDLAGIPELGDQAGTILEAARAEAAKRRLKVGEAPVSS